MNTTNSKNENFNNKQTTGAKALTDGIYYDVRQKAYWIEQTTGHYAPHSRGDALDDAEMAGLDGRRPKEGGLSEAGRFLWRVRRDNSVDWAGELAGHQSGWAKLGNRAVLVTRGYDLIAPQRGKFELIDSLVRQLLGEEQLQYFEAVLKLFYESLRDRTGRPGQMMIFCGPRDCFKSFVQHQIITPLWGGRSSDATRYLTGRTEFNAELAAAEHLFLDDAKPLVGQLSRNGFAEHLKGMIVGKLLSVHEKGKTAINLPVYQRITMSVNDDASAIRTLPALSESFSDKVHLFKCHPVKLPMRNRTHEERLTLEAAIQAELPAYLDALLQWEIPDGIAADRFGVRHYQHPELIRELEGLSEEAQLDRLVELCIRPLSRDNWIGSAAELYAALTSDKQYSSQAERLLNWENVTGTLLGKLHREQPEKFLRFRDGDDRKRLWKIVFAGQSV